MLLFEISSSLEKNISPMSLYALVVFFFSFLPSQISYANLISNGSHYLSIKTDLCKELHIFNWFVFSTSSVRRFLHWFSRKFLNSSKPYKPFNRLMEFHNKTQVRIFSLSLILPSLFWNLMVRNIFLILYLYLLISRLYLIAFFFSLN